MAGVGEFRPNESEKEDVFELEMEPELQALFALDDDFDEEFVSEREQDGGTISHLPTTAPSPMTAGSSRMSPSAVVPELAVADSEVDLPPQTEHLLNEVRDYVDGGKSANTVKKMKASIKKFAEFIGERGETRDMLDLDIEHLDALLAVFLKGLKKKDGEQYQPVSVQSFSFCIRKHLSENMLDVDSEKSFPVSKSALTRKKNELKSMGKGNRPNRAQCLSEEDEEQLWQSGALGDSTPEILLHTLWYLCTKLLGFRASHEARQMMWNDLELIEGREGEYLVFNERLTKTRTGAVNGSREYSPKMFANMDQPERCPVRLYKLYLEKRPAQKKCDFFFLSINHNTRAIQWYLDAPMGINRISEIMPRLAKHAKLPGKFTNHSVRRTMCSQLLNSRMFDVVTVAQLTGHKDPNSLKQYMTATEKTQRAMCSVLQNPSNIQNPGYQAINQSRPQIAETNQSHDEMNVPEAVADHVATPPIAQSASMNPTLSRMPQPISIVPVSSAPAQSSMVSANQNMLRGTFAGACFNGPVTINFNLSKSNN